jgi:hypothetical protein
MTNKLMLLALLLPLVGCSVPVTVAGLGVWGATGKSVTDHTLSYTTDSDCVTTRALVNTQVCQDGIYRQEQVFAERTRQ